MFLKIIFVGFTLQLLASGVFSQNAEKIWLDKKDSVYGYYVVIPPRSARVQAALILLDGYGGNADGFFAETKIHNTAYGNDILSVCISTGFRMYADSQMLRTINTIASDVIGKYHLRKEQFAIGGMSSGGTIALRYAQLCAEKPSEYPISPQAVFSVDGPVDLLALYRSSETQVERGKPEWWWLGEARMIVDKLKKEFGDPKVDATRFSEASPFIKDAREPGNEKFLKNIAVRTYHDLDVDWHIKNRHRSIEATNMLPASELVNRLALLGNDQAEFIASKIPGYRINGQRNPHSWNIVDEIELIQWLKSKLNFYPGHLKDTFNYEAPANWGRETILFPIDFAPSLPYKGFEELRFAPGWGDANSGEKWAYTILWWLDKKYTFNEKILTSDLETYFTGLTHRRAVADTQDMKNFKPAKASVKRIKTQNGDAETYTASVAIFDAQVTRKPGILHFKIHVKACPGQSANFVLFEAAGSSYDAPIWKELDKINDTFRCKKD